MRQTYTIEPTEDQWLVVEVDHSAESFAFSTGPAGAILNSDQLGLLMSVVDMMHDAFVEAVELVEGLDELEFESEDEDVADVGGPTLTLV